MKEKMEHHQKHKGHSAQMFLNKFWISLILAIPILFYSDLPEALFGFHAPAFSGSEFLMLIFGSIVYFFGGWIFVMGAARELKARLPGMMTLIALAITAAYSWSIYATFFGQSPLFWELVTLIVVMLLGHFVEMRAVQGAQGALKELAELLPDKVEVVNGNKIEIAAIDDLIIGDIVLIKPGAKVPVDGVIIDGASELNEAILTGESKLQTKKIGDEVIAGTTNGDGGLKVKVLKVGEQTFLSGVIRLVAQAQSSKSRLQILSDKAALYLTIIAVVAGIATLIGWLIAGSSLAFATARLVTVLVIACPHALGLAVPLVAAISTNMAARVGFLVKQRLSLEAARDIDIVLFDKTGTLTEGEFGVDAIIPAPNFSESEVLKLVSSVNRYSEHAIAQAIVEKANEANLKFYDVKNFQRLPGKGARAQIQGQEIFVGSEQLLIEVGVESPREIAAKIKTLTDQGKTIIYLLNRVKVLGAVVLTDIIREESKEAIKLLKEQNIKIAMVTGDSQDVASWVAKELGIGEYFARVLPDQKADKVKLLQSRGLRVAMVGDGVNDAPALAQSDVGIAVGAGTNVAIESAGIILMRNDPRDIPKIIRLSQITYSKMIQNLFWAVGYNIVALPLAAGVLAFKGVLLEPSLGAVMMSLSTVIVAINAVLLRRKKI